MHSWHEHDPRYGSLKVRVWHGLHSRLTKEGLRDTSGAIPIVRGDFIRVEVKRFPKSLTAVKKTLWLWWLGLGEPNLDLRWRAYLKRFDIKHTYRFVKNTLGWATPVLRKPEKAERWTWLVARGTWLRHIPNFDWPAFSLRTGDCPGEKHRHPWRLSPVRVRRGFSRFVHRSAQRRIHRK